MTFNLLTKSLYYLQRSIIMKKKWNGTCICGHKHNKHKEISFSPNYTKGQCTKCKKCKYFNHLSIIKYGK